MQDDTPSSTALLIARATVLLSQEPRYESLVPAEAATICQWFVQAYDGNNRFTNLCHHRWFRALMFAVERRVLPGILVHYFLRKHALEETVRQAIAGGCRQVVILGAGFDTLALRLQEEYSTTQFLEVDHPATQKIKRTVLESRGRLASNLTLLPVDLGHANLEQTLSLSLDYQPQSPMVFIAEGLLMYLPPEQVTTLFDTIHRQCGPMSRFAFTFLEPQSNGIVDFQHPSRIIGWWLRRRHEPFRWGISQTALPDFLEPLGFTLDSVRNSEELRYRFMPQEAAVTRVNGDLVCVAYP